MKPTPHVQDRIRRYLLGQLNEAGRAEIEQQLMTDEGLFEEVLAGEDELIDEYLGGELDADERNQFEQHFLATAERQEKLRFAGALNRHARTYKTREKVVQGRFGASQLGSQSWLLRAAAAIGVVAVIAGALWLYFGRTPAPQTFATLTLSISSNNRAEGAQAAKVNLPLPADALKIAVKIPDPAPPAIRYRVEIADANGGSKTLSIAEQGAQSVSVVVMAGDLKRGQYALKLFATYADGAERRIAGSYFFDVE